MILLITTEHQNASYILTTTRLSVLTECVYGIDKKHPSHRLQKQETNYIQYKHHNQSLNSALRAWPNLEMASEIFSSLAAAKVARKNIFLSSNSLFALNQLPRETSTPLLTAAWKMSSSMSARVFPEEKPGCFCQSTSIQC